MKPDREQPTTPVILPDELWAKLLEKMPGATKGIETSVQLFSGEIIERLIISNRGAIVGREAAGLAGAQGTVDCSMLTFGTNDIEAVQVPTFRFWKKPIWVALNPDHPARRRWLEGSKEQRK